MLDEENKKELNRLVALFKTCGPMFVGLGDAVRQKLLMDIAEAGTDGLNVTDIAARSSLSRPAVSHHLKVLKDCALVSSIKKGTQIFYRVELRTSIKAMHELIAAIETFMDRVDAAGGAAAVAG